MACLIALPAHSPGSPETSERIYLEATVEVVRIVVSNGNGFGVGCQIRQYRVINSETLPSWAVAEAEQKAVEPAIEQPV